MLLTTLRCPGRPSAQQPGTPQISRQNGPEWKAQHPRPSPPTPHVQLQIRPSTKGHGDRELNRVTVLPEAQRHLSWGHISSEEL